MRAWCQSACLSSFPRRSLAIARSLFPAQSSSGLPVVVFPLPSHRMSDELVKTAPADRPSVKPLQSVPVSCRHRIGCRMMSPLTACPPLRHMPPSSCLVAAYSSASLIRLVPLLAVRVVSRFACLSRLALRPVVLIRLTGIPVSSHPLRLLARFTCSSHLLILSAMSARLAMLALPVPRVAGRSVSRLAFISSCVLLVVVIRLRMSSPRSCVPLLPCRLCLVSFHRPASSCRLAGRYRTIGPVRFFLVGFLRGQVLFSACLCYNLCRGDGDLRIGAFVPRSHMPHLL